MVLSRSHISSLKVYVFKHIYFLYVILSCPVAHVTYLWDIEVAKIFGFIIILKALRFYKNFAILCVLMAILTAQYWRVEL